jgi:hypothetical protein
MVIPLLGRRLAELDGKAVDRLDQPQCFGTEGVVEKTIEQVAGEVKNIRITRIMILLCSQLSLHACLKVKFLRFTLVRNG